MIWKLSGVSKKWWRRLRRKSRPLQGSTSVGVETMGIVVGGPWQPPVISSTPSPGFTTGTPATYDFSTHVTRGLPTNVTYPITYTLNGTVAPAFTLSASTGVLTYDGAAAATNSVTLTVTDNNGSDTSPSFNLTVAGISVSQSIPSITLGINQTHDMSQYITDPASEVTSTQVLNLDTNVATYSDATKLLTGVAPGNSPGLQLEVTAGLSASGVTGDLTADSQVTIAYDGVNGFGATGPTIVLFEDHRNHTAGVDISTNATVGAWSEIKSAGPEGSNDNPRSGSLCGTYYGAGGANYIAWQANVNFSAADEVFVSYAWRIPTGTTWPGTASLETYPAGSQWKPVWWMYQDGSGSVGGEADLVTPSYVGGNVLTGNEGNNMLNWSVTNPSTYHTFGSWARNTTWLRVEDGVNDSVFFQGVGPAGYASSSSTTRSIFESVTPATFSHVKISSWADSNWSTCAFQHDDIYIATGAGAAARVEIGDNATYASCTDLAIATVDSWSNTSVTCTLRSGGFADFDGKYIHIHDADNNYVGSSRLIS